LARTLTRRNTKKQVYAFTRLGFFSDRLSSRWHFRLWLDVPVENRRTGHLHAAPRQHQHPARSGASSSRSTKSLSTYYSYSTNANGVLFNGQALFQEGRQHEFGVKSEFFDQRLSISAAHFQIKQNNIVTPNPSFFIDPINNPQSFKADLSNHGNELDVVGGITKDFSVVASYTTMKLRDAFGRRLRNIPDTTPQWHVEIRFSTRAR